MTPSQSEAWPIVLIPLAAEEIIGKELKNQQQSPYLLTLGNPTIWALCLRLNTSMRHRDTSRSERWE